MNTQHGGRFVISLDFELLWGVRDKRTIESYGDNIAAVWDALPRMLKMFDTYDVKVTFATVGFLFASNKEELLAFSPDQKPAYTQSILSPYNGHFDLVKKNEQEDPYHFASKLVDLIAQYPDQEIATHTFSHYYCLENGQTLEDFRRDIAAAVEIAKHKGVVLKSLVFPRNQFNEDYLEVCKEFGITSYRGNESAWFHRADSGAKNTLQKRAFRLLDAYINVGGHHCYSTGEIAKKKPYDIPSSRFLRPWSSKLRFLEKLRLRRILSSMTHAARKNKVYHLWWHPHNFGANEEQNFAFLEAITKHYQKLQSKYDFESQTMRELASQIEQNHG